MRPLVVVTRERPEELSRFDLWNSPDWQRFGHVRSIALGDQAFSGRLEHGSLGPISLCRLTAAGHRVEHPAEHLTADGQSRVKVLLQMHGTCVFQQQGHTVVLTPGDYIIYEPASAYTLLNPHAVEQFVLSLPRDYFSLGKLVQATILGEPMSARSGHARLAFALLRTTLDELPNCDERSAERVASVICSLLLDAVRDKAVPGGPVSLKLVLRMRTQDFIEANLSDPELGVEMIAQRLKCSKRYLHEVFGDSDLTIARYIWRRRLERCKDELVNQDRAPRSLTDLALAWGFSGLAHFSKAFKQEFGASPSEFRSR